MMRAHDRMSSFEADVHVLCNSTDANVGGTADDLKTEGYRNAIPRNWTQRVHGTVAYGFSVRSTERGDGRRYGQCRRSSSGTRVAPSGKRFTFNGSRVARGSHASHALGTGIAG